MGIDGAASWGQQTYQGHFGWVEDKDGLQGCWYMTPCNPIWFP